LRRNHHYIVGSFTLAIGLLVFLSFSGSDAAPTLVGTGTPLLPGRPTATVNASFASRTPGPQVTSPFVFPTPRPELSPTPSERCETVFPLSSLEAIEFDYATIAQLEAAFGQSEYIGGRPIQFQFEDGSCIMTATMGIEEVQQVELISYGTLGLLIDHYGSPAAAGTAEGNLTFPWAGSSVVLYPEEGIIAVFEETALDDLQLTTPISSLIFLAPYDLQKQLTRLKVTPDERWEPPLR